MTLVNIFEFIKFVIEMRKKEPATNVETPANDHAAAQLSEIAETANALFICNTRLTEHDFDQAEVLP